jgi:hypothetical protein
MNRLVAAGFLVTFWVLVSSWGFHAHRTVTRMAVFTLPPDMAGFYKRHLDYLTEVSVNPDRRRYADPDEGPRHFIDVEHYGDSALQRLPRFYAEAEKAMTHDSLNAGGRLPWHIQVMYFRLREAFLLRDPEKILRLSGELGHYIADAHVPLHTTENYNGQLTGQEGVHAFWESRLPELFSAEYNYMTGKAELEHNPVGRAWAIVSESNRLVDSVLAADKALALEKGNARYNYETRGKQTVRVISVQYAKEYHRRLRGMVERRMRGTVKTTSDFWYTAWVEAGQPDLKALIDYQPTAEELERRKAELAEWRKGNQQSRESQEEH